MRHDNMKMRMNDTRRGMLAAVLLAAVLALGACAEKKEAGKEATAESSEKAEKKEEGIKLTPEEMARAGVKVESLAQSELPDIVTVTATIKANQDRWARVAPRVEGRIVRVTAHLGDHVKAGQPLAQLDSVQLGEAMSSLRQAQASHRVAQADYERASKLAAEEIVPQKDVLRARADLEKANAELAAAREKNRLLGAVANGSGSGFVLAAPIQGTVIQKKATIGELASPNEPVFTVADLSRVWIEANLTEDLLAKVRPGAAATVIVNAYPGERFSGRVTYIGGVLDKDSRTTQARIEVENPEGRLKPEMFATAEIATSGKKAGVLAVPDTAVLLMQGQPSVFVEGANGFEQRAVETGENRGGRTVIKSGVKPGEKVVTAGAYALKARVLKSQISDEH